MKVKMQSWLATLKWYLICWGTRK